MKQRIVTGTIGAVLFLGIFFWSPTAYSLLALLLAVIGYHEYIKMAGLSLTKMPVLFGLGWMIVMILTGLGWLKISIGLENYIWIGLFVFLVITVLSKNQYTINQIAYLFTGVLYIGLGFKYMGWIRSMEQGLFWSMLLLFCTWASDTGAYFGGRFFGKNKLWPSISPNKTIEGSLGGVLAAMLVAVCFALLRPELVGYSKALAMGFMIAAVGQLGDLIQSAYKRVYEIKDTGALLPGHGGVLDRFDSLLIVFPFMYFTGWLN